MQSLLDRIESLGNRLPHPAVLFALACASIALLSAAAALFELEIEKLLPAGVASGDAPESIVAQSLLSSDGIWWWLSHLVSNFVQFPPLGIVLVGMIGIGVAERSGFITAVLAAMARAVGDRALTPAMIFLGIISSIGLDAGYVVLPPIAATLYILRGRSPIAGIAAAFAGISAGFSANLVITAVDPLLAGFTEAAAQFVDPGYRVAVTANWWFMAVSTFVLTGVGWFVSARIVEPRANLTALETPDLVTDTSGNGSAMRYALLSIALCGVMFVALSVIPGAPLHGLGNRFPRWVEATVPMLFIFFVLPGCVYGYRSGTFRNSRDVADSMGKTLAELGPYIVLAFFAAQFIAAFKYSRLGEMLAITGGSFLTDLAIPPYALITIFVCVVMFGNLLVGSASAKYAFFAPVFVPMFMYVGISPELTQVAYRVGDSITNVITPLNPYMVIVLALIQRFLPRAGLGTVVAMMLPYTIAFAVVWISLLLVWQTSGVALGPGGSLTYP